MQQPTHSSRFQEIDALRGVAALLVVWMHVTELFVKQEAIAQHGTWLYEVARTVDFGRVGVVLFFAISGFVICHSLRGEKKIASQRFLIRRTLRLYPAFWLSVVLSTWLFVSVLGRQIEASTIVANLTMIPVVLGESQILGLYWTLETELVFYLLCWMLFMTGLLRRPEVLAALMWLMMLLFGVLMLDGIEATEVPQWQSLPYHLSIMLWGGLLRYWFDHRGQDIRVGSFNLPLTGLLLIQLLLIVSPLFFGLMMFMMSGDLTALMKAIPYVMAVGLFLVFGFWIPLRIRWMAWIGAISYSLYLFHPLIFLTVNQLLPQLPEQLSELHLGVYLLVCAILSIVLAASVYYLVEKPAIRLAGKWTRHTHTKKPQEQVPSSEVI
ncbi:acyltransferase family protein [Marinicella sp. W31]|uniref:acyltransferase family protein n=1 Tax=Marinicella sp. W31 TaxID=3023713 RepID=UPI0037569948